MDIQNVINQLKTYSIKENTKRYNKNTIDIYERNYDGYTLYAITNDIVNKSIYESYICLKHNDDIVICLYKQFNTYNESKNYFIENKLIIDNNDINLILRRAKKDV